MGHVVGMPPPHASLAQTSPVVQGSAVDDAIERLVFMARVEEGLAQLDAGQGISHEEIKRRFGA